MNYVSLEIGLNVKSVFEMSTNDIILIISFNRISFSYTIDLTSKEAGVIQESITNRDRNIVTLNLNNDKVLIVWLG